MRPCEFSAGATATSQIDGIRPILAICLSAQGKHTEANEQLTQKVRQVAAADHDISYWLASAYLLQGRQVEALNWLETAIRLGNENYRWFESDPNWADLHEDPRFHELMDGIRQTRRSARAISMKTFVIGDIHGRCAQLLNLLDMLPRDETADTLVFLGDLIDRGADAPGCVEHVIKRREGKS